MKQLGHLDDADRTPTSRNELALKLLQSLEKRQNERVARLEGKMGGVESSLDSLTQLVAQLQASSCISEAQIRTISRQVAEHLAGPVTAAAGESAAATKRAASLGALLVALVTGGGWAWVAQQPTKQPQAPTAEQIAAVVRAEMAAESERIRRGYE